MKKIYNVDWETLEEAVAYVKFDALPIDIREWTTFRTIYEKCVEALNSEWDPSTLECVTCSYEDFILWIQQNSCFGMPYKHSPFELYKDLNHYTIQSDPEKLKIKELIESYIDFYPIIYVNDIFNTIKHGVTVNADYKTPTGGCIPKYTKGDVIWNAPTLKNTPIYVGGQLQIVKNNNFKQEDLQGSPEYVGGDFIATGLGITSIKGISKKIDGRLVLTGNKISDISELAEIEIENAIHLSSNNITQIPKLKTKTGNIFVESNNITHFEIPKCGILWMSSNTENCKILEDKLKTAGLDYDSIDRSHGKIFKTFIDYTREGKRNTGS